MKLVSAHATSPETQTSLKQIKGRPARRFVGLVFLHGCPDLGGDKRADRGAPLGRKDLRLADGGLSSWTVRFCFEVI